MLTEADLGGGWSLSPRPGNWASQALGATEGCESFWASRGSCGKVSVVLPRGLMEEGAVSVGRDRSQEALP